MTRKPTVSDHIVERLKEWNIRRIFGFPGDGINGVLGALHRAGGPEFIQTANEELAGLMACAHAKFTGEVGVCLSTGGPGAIHMLNGLYDAKLDHQPVVAIVGQQSQAGQGGSIQQETDIYTAFRDVASSYLEVIATPEQVRHVIDRAFRIAQGERTVTAIIVPHDVQRMDAVKEPPRKHGMLHSSVGYTHATPVPPEAELRRAAAVLNEGKRIAILAGAGAVAARDEIIELAERTGAGVAKALLGKSVVEDTLAFVTGTVGWLGTPASNWMMEECDTLLMIGSTMPYTEFLPREGQARGVQIDIKPKSLGLRYPMEVLLAGDAAATLRALLPFIEAKRDQEWRQAVRTRAADAWRDAERQAMLPGTQLNPQRVVWELSGRLPERAVITGDSGSSAVWIARQIRMRKDTRFSVSGGLATMGSAVPYGLAAKMANPDSPVIAIVGDGAMQMSGINSLIDVAKYWRRWQDPRFIVLILNNRDLNYVTWEQRVMEGDPRFEASQALPDLPYATIADAFGLRGRRLSSEEDIGSVLDEALASDRPFVIDAVVDPHVPTIPPTLRPEQQEKLAKALEQDPDAAEVFAQVTPRTKAVDS